jgi:hypothetical protein
MIEFRPMIHGKPPRRVVTVNGAPHYFHSGDPFEIASRMVANRDRRSRMVKRQVKIGSRRVAHRSSI